LDLIRPLRLQDAEALRAFIERLSPESRYGRFQYVVKEATPQLLRLLLEIDPRSHVALGAFDGEELVGEARYVRQGDSAEFALAVADDRRRHGLARRLLDHLLQAARGQGLRQLKGEVLAGNQPMLEFVARAGFRLQPHLEDARLVHAHKDLANWGQTSFFSSADEKNEVCPYFLSRRRNSSASSASPTAAAANTGRAPEASTA
jgi:acetyltransferase